MKHVVFFIVSTGIIGTRIYDYIATRKFRTESAQEANLLPEGQGFSVLLFIITLYIIYAFYISYFRRIPDLFPKKKGMRFREFIPYCYLGYPDKFRALLWKIPNSFSRFNSFFGPVLAWSLLWAGLVTTAMWILINNTGWYYPAQHHPLTIYLIMVAGVLVVTFTHFANLYRQYRRQAKS
jgi:hypothetical protein